MRTRGESRGERARRRRTPAAALVLALVSALVLAGTARADDPVPEPEPALKLMKVAKFKSAIDIKPAPGFPRLLFVADTSGKVWVLRDGKPLERPFLNIKSRVRWGYESGLLSIAFPPDYRTSGRFYVYYVNRQGDIRIDEFHRKSPVRAAKRSMRNVMTIRHRETVSHFGGHMHFDGHLLYFGTGDGGKPGDPDGNAQNPGSLLGKMLRIDPRKRGSRPYTVPRSNPYIGWGRPEVYAIGFRNPYRWSFDRYTSDETAVAITDVGFDEYDEFNYLSLEEMKGANFGWNRYEGFMLAGEPLRSTHLPQFVLAHPENCAIIGGLVVRDERLPSLLGRYLFSDFCDTGLRSVLPGSEDPEIVRTGVSLPTVTSFGEGPAGGVYATTYLGGLYRLTE